MANSPSNKDKTEIPDWVMNLTPTVMKYIEANPDSKLAGVLAMLVKIFFHDGEAEFPELSAEDKTEMAAKSKILIDPSSAPSAYMQAIGDPDKDAAKQITVHQQGKDVTYTLDTYVEDDATGFKGAIYKDANNHAVVFFGGMDSLHMDIKDAGTMAQAILHRVNSQQSPAQDLFLKAMHESDSVEFVGYSMGAMLGNHMATLGAKGTNFADVGLADVRGPDGKSLYTAEDRKRVHDNVTSLKLANDPYYAHAGHVYGTEVNLPSVSGTEVARAMQDKSLPTNFNAQASSHLPIAYVLAGEKYDSQHAPTATGSGPVQAPRS